MLARSATAGQATFEPDEEDVDDVDDEDDDDPEPEPEDELETVSFLSLLPPLSPEDLSPEDLSFEEESELELSDFLPSEPFADEVAGSELFWAARLSVR
jgi:hypothetical protein